MSTTTTEYMNYHMLLNRAQGSFNSLGQMAMPQMGQGIIAAPPPNPESTSQLDTLLLLED